MSLKWNVTSIGELCSNVSSGGTPKSTNEEYYGGDIPWLNTKEINFNRIYDTEKHITKEGFVNSAAKWVQKDSVIVAMYGATAAKVAMNKVDLTTNQACCNLTIDKSLANPKFVYYYLYSNYERLLNLASGAAQQNLNSNIIKEFPINIPPLSIQNEIVNILSIIDDKIEINQKINKNLEKQLSLIFDDWFVKCSFYNKNELVKTDWGYIPTNWKNIDFGDMVEITSGDRPEEKSDIQTEEFNIPLFGASKIMGYTNKYTYNEPILIIGRVGTHGIIQRVNYPCFPSDNTFIIKAKNYGFIYQILNRIDYDSLNTGSTQPLITQKSLKRVNIVQPDDEILEKYENLSSRIFGQINNNDIEILKLSQLRDTLLPKLMSGEIDVSKIEIE